MVNYILKYDSSCLDPRLCVYCTNAKHSVCRTLRIPADLKEIPFSLVRNYIYVFVVVCITSVIKKYYDS